MKSFCLTTEIRFGIDSLASLHQFAGRRVFLVTDSFLAGTELFQEVVKLVGPQVTIFDQVLPNPTISLIGQGLAAYLSAEPEVVIAYGGGSPIDAAKAIHKAAGEIGKEASEGLVVVPTTSGSGSEVTSFAVLTDESSQVKIPMVSPDLVPRLAVLDPRVVVGVPAKTTADSGMDALTHATEAYVSTQANDFSDACAEKSIQLGFTNLLCCFQLGNDLTARSSMHNASTLAAIAFNNSGLGIVHSLAHALGGRFPVAHGRLNAILLPKVIAFNAARNEHAATKYAWLGHLTGSNAVGVKAGVTAYIVRIEKLNTELGIGSKLSDCGIAPADLRPELIELAETALVDGCTATNPVNVTREDLVTILRQVAN